MEDREIDGRRELDELRREIAELRASRLRLVLAADAERRDIERALHDGLQQQVVGLAANLELAAMSIESDPEAAAALLADMRNDLREALDQSRTLAHRVYPPLDVGGLAPALRFAAANADVRTRIDVAVGGSVPNEVLGAIYFCCLDVLERAAGAAVTITVRDEDGRLEFEIEADLEIDAEPSPMRDRLEALGGGLSLRSEPGRPTFWSGSVPLP